MKEYYQIVCGGLPEETFTIDQFDEAEKEFKEVCESDPDMTVELLKIKTELILTNQK